MLTRNPEDPEEIAEVLDATLNHATGRGLMARTAQRRLHDEFLIFTQLKKYLRMMAECAVLSD